MEQHIRHKAFAGSFFSSGSRVVIAFTLLFTACGTGGDSDQAPNTPLSTPMALVVNQDDTTLSTVRLDGVSSVVIGTLSLGPRQADAIGGVAFSLGEWIFVTNTATNQVATIDPIGGLQPIFESFLTTNPLDPRVKIGQRPTRIYRDPVDQEVLWTMNDGDPATGLDTVANCSQGGSVSVLHNSHLGVGGEIPRVTSIVCLSGKGAHFIAFSRPPVTAQELAFVSSQTTGLISIVLPVPTTGGDIAWSEFFQKIDLCDSAKEASLGQPACDSSATTANRSLPAGMFWSQATGKIYSYLAGYRSVVEIDPTSFTIIRRIDVPQFQQVALTPDGRFLFLVGEDSTSDPAKVIGRIGFVDLIQPALTLVGPHALDHVRPAQFRFTADGKRLYMTQTNATIGLTPQQSGVMLRDKLLVFDATTWPMSFPLLTTVDLPSVGPLGVHALDLWVTGPKGAGSAKGIVVTNALHSGNGSVSLIDATNHAITATIPVGRNPMQVTVYYVGLAASDNQATPTQ
jgi:YVTN family beta-propeller protein